MMNIRGQRSVTCKADFDKHPSEGPLPPGAPQVCEEFRRQPDALERADALDQQYGRNPDLAAMPMYCVPFLASLLRQGPSEDVIDAVSVIADEECIVLLGRIARSTSPLSDAALNALENIDHPRASTVALAVRGRTSAIPRGSAVGMR
jgi:hypothetical protein